jgi:predicted AAA+ superfamily ATPase
MKSSNVRHRWFDSYRQTYLERDLLNIRSIENIPDFNRLLSLMAFRTGGLLNLSDLSRETGLPFTTLRRYVNLLEVTYQVFLLTPYYANIGKRLVKTSKVFMNDTGMACYLRGIHDWSALEHQGQVGAMVETWAASEILKLMAVTDYRFHLYFWRTHAGHEVDFLLELGGRLVAIEVKWSSKVDESAVSSLERCHHDLKEKLIRSIILYGGSDVVALTPKIMAVPYPVFFGM